MNEINKCINIIDKQNRRDDVILAILRLSRALRRCTPERKEDPFHPAIGRLLTCVWKNSGVSSRELCKLLDLRPSSLSEMLSRAEAEGWLTRTADENDRRIQHIVLSEKGQEIIYKIEAEHTEDYRKKTACFTEAEAHLFCKLCLRLTSHLDSLAPENPFLKDTLPRSNRPIGKPDYPQPSCPPASPAAESPETEETKRRPHFPDGARFRS